MAEVASGHPSTQRRRSERVSKSLPVIVRGIDLLGQPFEERTSTLAINLHGCRYASKHHLPKNTWVTLEVPESSQRRHVRARVAWIQRPHSVREFFQIAVELESPANIWSLASPPPNWETPEIVAYPPAEHVPELEPRAEETVFASPAAGQFTERFVPDIPNAFSESSPGVSSPLESIPVSESPLIRQWTADLERQAASAADAAVSRAADQIRRNMEEFEQFQAAARERLTSQIAETQQEILATLRSEFDRGFDQTRDVLQQLDRGTQALRAETQATHEAASRLAQSRLQIEAEEAARAQFQTPAAPPVSETDASAWRTRLESEMEVAQAQWNELLQSSLDSSLGRLVEQLSARSQELLRSVEQKISERFSELRQPLGQMYSEARETLNSVRSSLEDELGRARSSLTEIEHSAGRMKEYSAQLEAASHDTLNELHRRLENILQAQTDELHRRAEHVLAGVAQRLAPSLDSLSQQMVERTMADVDSQLSPRLERASELLHGLSSREAEADASLRLHRERLRQVSENNLRDAAAQAAATLSNIRNDFEAARTEALGKWNSELDASAARAAHTAAETIGRSSEWFQQEARARLQVLVEQGLVAAGGEFEAKTAEAARQFESRLDQQSSNRIAQINEQLDGVAGEVTGRARTQLELAAEAAAASFGQVLRRISEHEVENFNATSRSALAERERELGHAADQLLQNLESSGQISLDRFRAQMASHIEEAVAEGRGALAAESAAAVDGFRAQRDSHLKNWTEDLHRLSDDATAKHQDRLQNASDSWIVSSVRRLNEHGQDSIDSLVRSADQSLRDSCAKLFQGLSDMFRERPAAPASAVGFIPPAAHEAEEAPAPHNELANGANA